MKILYVSIFLILGFGLWLELDLMRLEWSACGTCMRVLGLPACYLLFAMLLLGLISHIFKFWFRDILFFSSMGVGFLIAFTGSISHLAGFIPCPDSLFQVPACFLSLGVFALASVLRYVWVRQ